MRPPGPLALLVPPLCWGCSGAARAGEPLCRRCRARLRPAGSEWVDLDGLRVLAAVSYEGPARSLVAALKFRDAPAVADAMAARIAASTELPPGAVLVPVPLHPARLRRRGYNQAERLATALGRRSGLRVSDCLERHGRRDRPQLGRGRPDRLLGPTGHIRAGPVPATPANALLVDDVVTTGATLRACASALREAGAVSLRAVVFARTQGR